MMLIRNLLLILTMGVVLAACRKNLEPLDDNHRNLDEIYGDPYFAEGLLMNAYTRIPTNNATNNGYSFSDVATDDAVTNDKFNPLLNMATGSWSAVNNPMDTWNGSFTAILYINLFLREVDSVNWSYLNPNVRILFRDRLKGECYGLRGYFMMNLLQGHAGYTAGGTELLGVPIITQPLDPNSDFSKPRNTFDECVQQIYADFAESDKYLPLDYKDITAANQLPAKYSSMAIADYNRVFGNANRQRMVGRVVKALRAKTALLAASPAYNAQPVTTKWELAANYAGEVLTLNGGIGGLDPQGGLFYVAANINAVNLANSIDQKEMLWRGNIVTNNAIEQTNFPPTLFGNGRVNPTQNLVDAFPMLNGYPIDNPASNYAAATPYANRDPRLRNYIVTNGSTFRNGTTFVYTKSDNPTNDAVNVLPTSTRTGYYLRKLLREDVNLNPASTSTQKHYPVHIRYTEMFLLYAEAANEAWGPDGKGTFAFSAREVIAAIRKRAGLAQPDNYLSAVTSKEDMRKLIRNERRLELSFEGFRFWDLRRWKENLTEAAKGVQINSNVFTIQTVEIRPYADYMNFGPIPFTEALKANLKQNRGW
ncbi:MAG: RagB/SusD family nutrient uptake outer membrane protein [Bacteroidota bacterium]